MGLKGYSWIKTCPLGSVHMQVYVLKSATTNLELSPILADAVLWVCVHRLPISQPGDDRSRVSSRVTVEDHGAVDHCSHFLQELLWCSHNNRRDWGGKHNRHPFRNHFHIGFFTFILIMCTCLPRISSSKCMRSSPASLTAWHVYFPASSLCTRVICSTCPPETTKPFVHGYETPVQHNKHTAGFNWDHRGRSSLRPGRSTTPSAEVSFRPSLYQLSFGGGMALLSQERLTGWPKTTSRFSIMSSLSSPSCPRPQAASLLVTRWKTGGTSNTRLSINLRIYFRKNLHHNYSVS